MKKEKRKARTKKYAAYNKKYYQEHKRECAAHNKKHYEKIKNNPKLEEKHILYAKEYYQTHKEEFAARKKRWYKRNPGKVLEYNNNRRALKLRAKGTATAKQVQDRWEFYGNVCYLCGKLAEAIDHIIPLSKGGSNWPANLRPICKLCNSTKGSKWPL